MSEPTEKLAEELPLTDLDEEALDEIWGVPSAEEDDELEERAARPVPKSVSSGNAAKKAWETRKRRKAAAADAEASQQLQGMAGRRRETVQNPQWRGERINELGNTIRNRRTEKLIAFDENGVVFEKSGTSDRVTLTSIEAVPILGNVMLHNHPNDTSFSFNDISTGARLGVFEIAAVTKAHNFRLMTEHEKPWPQVATMKASYDSIRPRHVERARQRLEAEGLPFDEVQATFSRELNREFAAVNGLIYMEEPARP